MLQLIQKEYGSDFHFIDFSGIQNSVCIGQIYPDSNLFFSGRSALFNIIQKGIELYDWEKIYLPEYYCHDITSFIKSLPINIFYYNDGPYNTKPIDVSSIDKKTNAILNANYFGFGKCSRLELKNAFIIEDHTHDLVSEWALNSTAQYCFASLRKNLPVPAGGIAWSPQKFVLPEIPAEKKLSNAAIYIKLSAMLLKKVYLQTECIEKEEFRTLFIKGETIFGNQETNGALPAIVQTEVAKIPIQVLREHKISNYKSLSTAINSKHLIWQQQINRICPFGFILFFEKEQQRNEMREYLINNRIYPAVLWPHQKEPEAKYFSNKSLLIHCDIRYNSGDMEAIAETINNYGHAN